MTDSSFSNENLLIPGPSFHVDLAALDARHPLHYSGRLLIFHCTSSALRDAQLAAFKAGLQALVSRYPILGGTVDSLPSEISSDGKQDWRTIVPGSRPGIELIVRDLRMAMPSFEEFEAYHFTPLKLPDDLLVPIPGDLTNDCPFAACKMQFSAIEGATIITFSMSHSVADGVGNNEIMRILAEETRRAQEHPSDSIAVTGMGLDRSALRNIASKIPFNIEDHPAYTLKLTSAPLEKAPPHPFEATSPEIPVLLRISAAKLAQLKADATLEGAEPISTHDALAALIWRTVLLIRRRRSPSAQEIPPSTLGSIFFPSDARRHLHLPQSYVGNAVYQIHAQLPLSTLFSPSGLQHAANAVRAAIKAVNSEKVTSLMAETNKRWVDWEFLNSYSTTGVGMGTDWTSGSLYGDEWGEAFGDLVRYRYPDGAGNCILPKLPNGGAEVVIRLLPGEVGVLKSGEGFGKYIEA
jgi:hypothetical protein